MNAARLPYLLLMLVTGRFRASAVQATDLASPVGFWKGQDGTFEMFESEGKRSARRQNLLLFYGIAGTGQDQSPWVYWNCIDGPKLHLDQSELRYATAFPTHFSVSRHTRKQR
ncbi:MAG TPA: hypothetical protein VFO40_19555 [Chthoniobacterales bacterium]|nr:hypothetical protein [Chthoniobacterales bacterium]